MDFTDLYSTDDATAQEQMRAQAAALRRQQNIGLLGQLTGDKVLSGVGSGLLQNYQHQADQLNQMPQQRLKMALAKQNASLEQQKAAQEQSYQQGMLGYHNQQLGIERNRLAQDAWSPIPGTTALFNKKTGEIRSGGLPGTPPGTSGKPLSPKDVDKEFKDMSEAVSTYRGRANLNRDNGAALQRAEALEALLHVPDLSTITPQQTREAYTALAGLISRGGPQALAQIEELTPHTLASKFANAKQYLLNEPAGANAQDFLKNLLDTSAREKKVLKEQIRRGQLQALPNFAHLRKIDRNRFESILRAPGVEIDPSTIDDNGLPAQTHEVGAQGQSSATVVERRKASDGSGRIIEKLSDGTYRVAQ